MIQINIDSFNECGTGFKYIFLYIDEYFNTCLMFSSKNANNEKY